MRSGVTLTDFVLHPALERANNILGRPEIVLLPAEQFDTMVAALNEPVTPIAALTELASRPRRFVRK